MKKMKKLKASAFLSAMLILIFCILFVTYYQQAFLMNIKNNQLLIQYFS